MQLPIYLDYAATTPVDPYVLEQMLAYLTIDGVYGNPASTHSCGRQAARAVEQAREHVAALINAEPEAIIWTSGATEANNLAIKGMAHAYADKGRHIVTCLTEHEAVLGPCRQLEREGFAVSYIEPQLNGMVTLEQLENACREDTILVSLMHVNNEIGVVQDIAGLSAFTQSKGILFHVDAAQSAGKIPIDVSAWRVDAMSLSAHKVYGPKGIGALYLRPKPKPKLEPLLHGGGQEGGLRPGTLPTHQIVGMGTAFALAHTNLAEEQQRILNLRHRLWDGIRSLGGAYLHGDSAEHVAGILNVAFDHIESSLLIPALKDIAVSVGSACHAASQQPSHVLRALKISSARAANSIRFSLGRFTTIDEIDFAIAKIKRVVSILRPTLPGEAA